MYRMLIVDDEPAIVEGLVQLFESYQDAELDVCKAYSASEALRLAKRTKVDLVLSDIRMPGMSGLEMIDDIQFYWPYCRFLFLTGYSEFDYAHTAIEKNVDHYLLKTEDDAVVLDAVRDSIRRLEEAACVRERMEEAVRVREMAAPLLRNSVLSAVLAGVPLDELETAGWGHEPLIRLDRERGLLIVVGKVTNGAERLKHGERLMALSIIRDLMQSAIPAWLKQECFEYDTTTLVWLLQPDPAPSEERLQLELNEKELANYVKSLLEPVQSACAQLHALQPIFVLSRPAVSWSELATEFERFKPLLQVAFPEGDAMRIYDLGMPDPWWKRERERSAGAKHAFQQRLKLLEKQLEEAAPDAGEALVRELLGTVKRELSHDPLHGADLYVALFTVFLTKFRSSAAFEERRGDSTLMLLSLSGIPLDWAAAERTFIALASELGNRPAGADDPREHLLIERIHEYVHNHLGGDLSLVRIAESVYFNPSYLSRYYKQRTGRNLFDYIYAAKAEAAVDMLANPKLFIHEIASRLGFESPSYFTAFFRKMKGVSPQEYRDSLRLYGQGNASMSSD
ncbi:response regulator [Paenibacillus sp. HJGM_3]|uniref:response regulator n=1 Tax=Paenibacillus sp. HJGM_3 TaxID=3379816 RepID=UPI00385973C2